MLYRLRLRGAEDGVVYGVKEFKASSSEAAAASALALVGDEPTWWDGQQLLVELDTVDAPAHEWAGQGAAAADKYPPPATPRRRRPLAAA